MSRYMAGPYARAWTIAVALIVAPFGGRAAALPPAPPTPWIETTFDDFIDGKFDDGGAQVYATAAGDIRFVNQFDFNQDGAIDLVFCNTHATDEKPDALIYWGGANCFSRDRVTSVATDGAFYNIVRDLNRDGWPELVLINGDNGISSILQSFVYWGGPEGYSHLQRSEFSTFNPGRCVAADLDGDGLDELVVPNGLYKLGTVQHDNVGVRIHRGTQHGYTDKHVERIGGRHVSCVAVGRFAAHAPGWTCARPDLFVGVGEGPSRIFYQGDKGLNTAAPLAVDCGPVNQALAIDHDGDGVDELLLNSGPGRSLGLWEVASARRQELDVTGGEAIAQADVDQDGRLDLIVAGQSVERSVIYWSDVSGWSQDRHTSLETAHAKDALVSDLNGDGHLDVAVAQHRDDQTLDADTLVIWGDGKRGLGTSVTRLPGHGTMGLGAGDINRDGRTDLVITGRISGSYPSGRVPTYIYWNDGAGGFGTDQRTELTTNDNYEAAAADFNLDGYPDLVFAEQFETQGEIGNSHIYWGGHDGFHQGRRTALPGYGPMGVSVADLNRDGYLDIVFGQLDRVPRPNTGKLSGTSRIYWGSPAGHSTGSMTDLPSPRTGTPGIGDFNRDGWLDLVFPGGIEDDGARLYWGGPRGFDPQRCDRLCFARSFKCETADLNADGWLDLIFVVRVKGLSKDTNCLAYLGGPSGFSEKRRLELPTRGAGDASIADLNRDGRLDVVLTNYSAFNTRQLPVYIYWGSATGWSPRQRTALPAHSGNGNLIADLNGDGWLDLALACHRIEGSRDLPGYPNTHKGRSYVYWGSADGYDIRRRLSLPTLGPHGMLGVDPGHAYHRRGEWMYVSSVHELDKPCRLAGVTWDGTTPDGTAIAMQVRAAESKSQLRAAVWLGPGGADSWFTLSDTAVHEPDSRQPAHCVQYRVRFRSQLCARYPILDRVEITFR